MVAQLVVCQLDDAALKFGVRTVDGREIHSLIAGKAQLDFTKAADEDVGKVDKRSGKTTFVGQSALEMVHVRSRPTCTATSHVHGFLAHSGVGVVAVCRWLRL